MLIAQLVFICGLVLMASASTSEAGIINDPNVATLTKVEAAAVTIPDDLKEKLYNDLTFRSFYDGLGFFSQRIPETYRAIYSELCRIVCTVILYSVPIPKDIGMRSLPEARNIARQNDTPFLLANNRNFAIYFFYQDSILRVAFFKSGEIITAGQASCNLEGFTKEMTMAYENGTSIIKHPYFLSALEYLRKEYVMNSMDAQEAMKLACFGLKHLKYDIFVETVSYNGQAGMVIDDHYRLPISIGVHDGHIFVRHDRTGKILFSRGISRSWLNDTISYFGLS